MKPQVNEREVPVVYRHVLSVDWFRQFTFMDRVRIFLGYNLVVAVRIATRNDPNKFQPIIAGEVTKETTPSSYLKEQMKNVLVEQKK